MLKYLLAALVLAAAPPALAQLAGVALVGPAGKTIIVDSKALAAGPRASVATEIHGKKAVYEGAPLTSLLAKVDAPTGDKLRGNELSSVVLVTASDGYQIALSLAETDPAVRKGAVILADKADGKALPAEEGPYRLIVEGDLKPARSARMVVKIEVKRLGEARPPSH
jgi:DMSO/TMAO reductase YedYZ molybdopterin-dependent catalytic subunit